MKANMRKNWCAAVPLPLLGQYEGAVDPKRILKIAYENTGCIMWAWETVDWCCLEAREEKTIGKIADTIRRYHRSWDWWNLWQCLLFLDCRNSQSRTRQINRGFGSRTCRVGKKPFPWRQVLFSVCKSCCFGWRITHGGRKGWWYYRIYSSCWNDQLSVVVIIVYFSF